MMCSRCKQDQPESEFGPSAGMWPMQRMCRTCNRRWAQVRRHGLDAEQRAEVAAAQGGCAICGHPEPSSRGWVVDHDRRCCPGDYSCVKCRRGVVCSWCNSILGFAFDRIESLRNAVDYLERNSNAQRTCDWHMPIACSERICGSLKHGENGRI